MESCKNFYLRTDGHMTCNLLPQVSSIAGPGTPNYPCLQCWHESGGTPNVNTPTIQRLLAVLPLDEFGERVNPRGDCKGCGG